MSHEVMQLTLKSIPCLETTSVYPCPWHTVSIRRDVSARDTLSLQFDFNNYARSVPPPIPTVPSGAEITFARLDGTGNDNITSILKDLYYKDNYNVTEAVFTLASLGPNFGPIHVQGAEPGDVIRIDVLDITHGPYGWSAIVPGYGLLEEEFTSAVLKIYDMTDKRKDYTVFKRGIHIPIRPFLGTITVAAPFDGPVDPIPPYFWGGNMDTKALTAGSRLYLPVQKPGGLISGDDGHSAQGDGEMTGTGIETPMSGRLRLTVEKKMPWMRTPHYLNPKSAPQSRERGQEYAVLGVDEDLRRASQKALSGILDWLVATKNVTREEAYILSSAVADLKITEAVDMPIYAVACTIPLKIFV